MKVLLDENLPHNLRHELGEHDVQTVQFCGWSGLRNGALLFRAASAGFDAMITMDSGVPYQQNLLKIPLCIVVLSAPSNDVDDLRPLLPQMRSALIALKPHTVVRIA